jgi:aspartate/glutamate racemase
MPIDEKDDFEAPVIQGCATETVYNRPPDAFSHLLEVGEMLPPSVEKTTQFLSRQGIWHQFSRNHPALSCQDAARKRNRLGHQGIPLWDELKSFLGEFTDSAGDTQSFLAHCRGDRELDLHEVTKVLNSTSPAQRRHSQENTLAQNSNEGTLLQEVMGGETKYGTIHPFLEPDIIQLFDHELMRPIGTPGTVMTNAGEYTWAVEFDPADIVIKLPQAKWANIITHDLIGEEVLWGVRSPSAIGILTGNPMDSGLELCQHLNKYTRQLLGSSSLGDVSMPKVIMLSSPQIGISMEMDTREDALRKALLDTLGQLCDSGAKIIAHPAHTTHYFASDLADRAKEKGSVFLSMVDVLVKKLHSLGVQEIALVGTSYMTDFSQERSVYRNVFGNIKVHTPSPNGWKKIHEIGYTLQQKGPTSRSRNLMRDVLKEVPDTCEHVVLVMTELWPVAQQLNKEGRHHKVLIDPLEYYGEALARAYLGLPTE